MICMHIYTIYAPMHTDMYINYSYVSWGGNAPHTIDYRRKPPMWILENYQGRKAVKNPMNHSNASMEIYPQK